MTFISGFAEGYINERNRRLEREAEKEDTQFKYGMDILMQNRERREKKRLEETELANKARSIAQNLGDPDFAATALSELRAGVDTETLQKRYAERSYQKNPKYVKKETTYKVPQGVDVREEQYDAGMNLSPAVQKRMDELDPTLRKGTIAADETYTTLDAESDSSPYIFKPQDVVDAGEYADAEYGLQLAIKSGDPAAIEAAKLKRDVHQSIETQKAVAKAKAEGKNVKSYVMLDENGQIASKFPGEMVPDADGKMVLKNVGNNSMRDSNGQPINLDVLSANGKIVEFSEDDAKQLFDLQRNFGKAAGDFNTARDKFTGALTSIKTIDNILRQYPAVTTMSSNAAVFVKDLQDEAAGAYTLLANEQADIENSLDNPDATDVGAKIANYEKSLNEFSAKFMSQGNVDLAMAKALYEGQRKLLSYQMAGANGISGAGLSKKDQENFYETTGGNKSAPEVMNAIRQTSYGVFNVLKSARDTLNNNAEVKAFEAWTKVKTGLIQNDRLEEHFLKVDPSLRPIIQDIARVQQMGTQGAVTAQPEQAQTPTVLPGAGGTRYEYVGPQPMTEELRRNKNNWKEVAR